MTQAPSRARAVLSEMGARRGRTMRTSENEMPRYTFSIGDRALPGERSSHPAKARARASRLAVQYRACITLLCDGLVVGMFEPTGEASSWACRLEIGSRVVVRKLAVAHAEARARALAQARRKTVTIASFYGTPLVLVHP